MDTSIILRKGYILNRAERSISFLNSILGRTDMSPVDRFFTTQAADEIRREYGVAAQGDSINLGFLTDALDLYTQTGLLKDM